MIGYACWYLTKAHVRYIKILTWLRGFLVIFLYLFWFSLCSSLFWELRDKRVDLEKFTILALKPRSHVRILIYRTWAIGSCISLRVSKIRSTRARTRCSSCSITKASKGEKCKLRSGIERLRACLHEGGGPQVGEVTCAGSPHLTCKRDQIKMRDYMDRRVTPPKRVTSPTWSPPPPCKQALILKLGLSYSFVCFDLLKYDETTRY